MPMFEKLKFPASAMSTTKEMSKIAQFDLIPTDWLSDLLWTYWPEEEPFSLNFSTMGYESTLFLQNIGMTFYVVLANFLYGLLHCLLYPSRRFCGCLQRLITRMENYLYFNGTIRFYMELFFDISLAASLNLQMASWESPFLSEQASNYIAFIFLAIICILPFCYFLVSCLRPELWIDEKFKARCGQVIFDGTSIKKQINRERALLLIPLMFFMRRAIFIIVVLRFREFLWV